MMRRFKGFSLIEVLATITILGILATISAPEYYKLRERVQFQSEVQSFVETIVDARNSALTNKKCSNGNPSVSWKVTMTRSPLSYTLRCFTDASTSVLELDVSSSNLDIIRTEVDEINTTPAPVATVSDVTFTFFAGPANAKLEYTESSTLRKGQDLNLVFGFIGEPRQQAVCFNPVAGFPTHNKYRSTCLQHN